ncbi:MAG: glycosyltransferase family 4 protein [Lachnospiraceae bacterium]|nr:glycosyltransferase family 4 protein [Lachnospiraceae bacterium]
MKTLYVGRSIIPSQSANSIHVMKICDAFAELCEDFELIVPENDEFEIEGDLFDYYGVRSRFPINRIKQKKGIGGWYRYYFALSAFSLIRKKKCNKIITRDPIVAFLAVLFHKKVVLDLHGELAHLCGRAYRIIKLDFFRKSKYLNIVMITESLTKYYEKKYGLDPKSVTVLPDGYTPENFMSYSDLPLLPEQKMRIAYAGSFGVGRGYEIIQELAKQDKDNKYTIYGGVTEDALKVTGQNPPVNISFKGFIANRDIPEALCNQDILLLPYQNTLIAKGEDTGKVMSPLKLFEYMAAGRVIIASDLQVLKEILNGSNCYFAAPDDVSSWKEIIDHISANRAEAVNKAEKAKQDVKQYTWRTRAERMLELMEEKNVRGNFQ